MTYEKQNFEDGQVLTAEHLNHMEQGIEDANNKESVTSWNDLTDRPFGKNKSGGIQKLHYNYLELGWLPVKSNRSSNVLYDKSLHSGTDKTNLPSSITEKYSGLEKICIIFNDVEYVCNVSKVYNGAFDVWYAIPEGYTYVTIDNAPLYLQRNVLYHGMSGSYTIEITEYSETVVSKMPLEYLPDKLPVEVLPDKVPNSILDLDWLPVNKYSYNALYENNELSLSSTGRATFDTPPVDIIPTKQYMVSWNGVDYLVKGEFLPYANGVGFLYIGNMHLSDSDAEDTGEPFLYTYAGAMNGEFMASCGFVGEKNSVVSCTIHEAIPVKNPLPANFIPEGVPCAVKEKEDLLPETQTVDMGDDGFVILDAINGVEIGNTYTVTYNGVPYECEAHHFDMEGITIVAFGNCVALELPFGNDEPFFMLILPPELVSEFGAGAQVMPLDGASSVTVAISKGEEIVQKIDERCLPDWLLALKPE